MADGNYYGMAEKLKKLRKRRGYTQVQVAERLGVKPNTISRYESGILTPSLEVLIEFAAMYNTSLDDLVGLSNRRNCYYFDDVPQKYQKVIYRTIDALKEQLEKLDEEKTGG